VERGAVRDKCLAQEHNTMSPARARTWTARSGDECNNHEATCARASWKFHLICTLFITSKARERDFKEGEIEQ